MTRLRLSSPQVQRGLKINKYRCFRSPFKILRQRGNAFLQTVVHREWKLNMKFRYYDVSSLHCYFRPATSFEMSLFLIITDYYFRKKLSSAIIMIKYNHDFWPLCIFFFRPSVHNLLQRTTNVSTKSDGTYYTKRYGG